MYSVLTHASPCVQSSRNFTANGWRGYIMQNTTLIEASVLYLIRVTNRIISIIFLEIILTVFLLVMCPHSKLK